ncbi:MAG: DUF3567 domain-containing protein [Ideonella sp.]|nr:DUF3567 domain-containing protein [Ideonella sp.]
MQMLYNSDSYVVMQIDVPAPHSDADPAAPATRGDALTRGGYEIVDKFARKEIFIEGAMAQSFKEGVEALIETDPSEDDMDDYIARYTSLMQQPVILH